MITLIVLFVGNLPKSIMSQNQFRNYQGKQWWDSKSEVEVPMEDWSNYKVDVTTIKNYL